MDLLKMIKTKSNKMGNYTNVHIQKWEKYIKLASDAIKTDNVDEADRMIEMANQEYQSYKEDTRMTYECKNFGLANHVFESVLPTIFKNNKKLVGNFTKTIKEDKNLMGQFMFYKSLESFNGNDAIAYVNEALELAKSRIDAKNVKNSNKVLENLIAENHIISPSEISENVLKFYENCDYVLTHKKTLSNLNEYTSKISAIGSYVSQNIKPVNENKENIFNLIENYEKKYGTLLNEEEKTLVQQITDSKKEAGLENKKKLFDKMKNECVSAVDKMILTCEESEKTDLLAIKEDINSREFCEETLVKDVAKLLELHDILMEN